MIPCPLVTLCALRGPGDRALATQAGPCVPLGAAVLVRTSIPGTLTSFPWSRTPGMASLLPGAQALGSCGEKASATERGYPSLLLEAVRTLGFKGSRSWFRMFPSKPLKGPERVSRGFSGQLPSWALSWPQAVASSLLRAPLQACGSAPCGPFPAQPTPDPGLPSEEVPQCWSLGVLAPGGFSPQFLK